VEAGDPRRPFDVYCLLIAIIRPSAAADGCYPIFLLVRRFHKTNYHFGTAAAAAAAAAAAEAAAAAADEQRDAPGGDEGGGALAN